MCYVLSVGPLLVPRTLDYKSIQDASFYDRMQVLSLQASLPCTHKEVLFIHVLQYTLHCTALGGPKCSEWWKHARDTVEMAS